jgi:hypothetical protein
MGDTVLSNQKSRVESLDQTRTTVSTEIDKVIIGSIAAFTGVVGLWSVACLMSAMFQAGGPIGLAGGYFKALAGM